LFDDTNSIWFPQVIGVFFLLGLLPQYAATNIWLILNIVLLLTFTWYLFHQSGQAKPKPLHFGILVVAVFLFPPTIRHLILGQVDILLIVSIIAGIYAIEKNQLALAGFLFSLALVKPQHSIVVLPSLMGYLLFNRKVLRDAFRFFGAICFFAIIQTAPLWVSSSIWFRDFLSNLQRNPNWAQPNVFSMLLNKFGVFALIFWFLLYIIILILSFQIWSKCNPQKAVLWSLALTTIISPYLWSWDFILLLPLLLDTAIDLSNSLARLTLLIFYVACLYSSIITLQGGNASDAVFWWFPIVLIIGIVASMTIDRVYRNRQIFSF
jgi:Gpi18-like mannosyltransferase